MTRHVHNELSAFLDGEARYPERIAAHLAECETCARAYRDLAALSETLRALPEPEIRPEFATRVMAHVREAVPGRARGAQSWLPFGLALAVIAAMIGGAWLAQLGLAPSGGDSYAPAKSYSTAANSAADDTGWMDSAWFSDEGSMLGELAPETIEPLAREAWTTPLVEAWGPTEDLDSMLLGLDDEAEANFRALLWLYAQDAEAILQ